jgi:phage terminase Nu1 subunit (DNA packaging protein)
MTPEEQMEQEELGKGYVRAEKLGQLLGVSQRQVQRLRADGALVTEKTKWGQRYHLVKSLLACVKYYMSKQDAQSEKQRAQTAEADYKERKAELLKIELRKRKGEVHEARHVQELINGMILDTKATLLAIPSRTAPDLAACHTENEIAAVLREALCEAMLEMTTHQYDPDKFRAMVEDDGDINADLTEEEEEE